MYYDMYSIISKAANPDVFKTEFRIVGSVQTAHSAHHQTPLVIPHVPTWKEVAKNHISELALAHALDTNSWHHRNHCSCLPVFV